MSGQHRDERDPIAPIQRKKKVIRAKDMPDETGLPMRSVWEQVAEGTLPAPIQIGPRAVGWLADEIDAWREQKRRERDERLARGIKNEVTDAETLAKRPLRKETASIEA